MAELLVLQAFDSLFPIGAFTMSNGLESYVRNGLVNDRVSLEAYLAACLYLLPYNDLGAAALTANGGVIAELDILLHASKTPRELRDGSRKLCLRFLRAQLALGDYPLLESYHAAIASGASYGHYALAVGLFVREVQAELSFALNAYCYSLLSATVNHAVKLVPLRQGDGQAALRAAMCGVSNAVTLSMRITPAELGVSGAGFNLRSMQHERLEGRLYIT
ncbi:MAG: hypothetical protein LBC65_03780 [Oscillospiraceae bacterium]|jgi:urease accessory protein|nr:hypothetical protein [Oscillospiraceae bacterium]